MNHSVFIFYARTYPPERKHVRGLKIKRALSLRRGPMKKLLAACFCLIIIFTMGDGKLHAGIDSGLVAHYAFTEGAFDQTGNDNIATVIGATPANDQFNDPNEAYLLDGTNDYISLQNGADPNGIKQPLPMTVTAWIKPNSLSDGLIFRNDRFDNDAARYGVAMRCRADGTIIAHVFEGGNTSDDRVSKFSIESVVNPGQWSHFAVVFYESNANKSEMQLFWNGVELEGQYDGTGSSLLYTETQNGAIGLWKYNGSNVYYDGSIDEVRVYNRTLSSAEIRQLAFVDDSLLVWPLSEGRIWTYHCQDALGNEWTETREVIGSADINGKHFYTVRFDEQDGVFDVKVVSTDHSLISTDGQGNETMDYIIAPEGFTIIPDENRIRELVAIESMMVPFGGPYKAYSYGKTALDEPGLPVPFMIESFVPGIGFVKIVDHWHDNPPVVKELVSVSPGPLCGDHGYPYPQGDLNHDCIVDLEDVAISARNWLKDNRPN